jgi:hypothetical protein
MLPPWRNFLSVGSLFGSALQASFTGLYAKWCQGEVAASSLVPET